MMRLQSNMFNLFLIFAFVEAAEDPEYSRSSLHQRIPGQKLGWDGYDGEYIEMHATMRKKDPLSARRLEIKLNGGGLDR
ncbi:hypothetical protein F5Y18DRAFT_342015 [Xylariaceae sp. FL1019]|nr:hypothetical protein F5Y18DRAFT_342015 [Xylariaceae sp. FL1019]